MTAWLLLAALALDQGPPRGLREGMTPAQVRAVMGEPSRVGRQVLAHRALEYWHYSGERAVLLTFDCHRGQLPRLSRITAP
jgi:hypothetical protein